MRKAVIACCIILAFCTLCVAQSPAGSDRKVAAGEELFKKHCAACHPDGGNIVNPEKTLHKKNLTANKITSVKDIIGKMRNPGPGMQQFDQKTVSDEDAAAIAQYILKTFK